MEVLPLEIIATILERSLPILAPQNLVRPPPFDNKNGKMLPGPASRPSLVEPLKRLTELRLVSKRWRTIVDNGIGAIWKRLAPVAMRYISKIVDGRYFVEIARRIDLTRELLFLRTTAYPKPIIHSLCQTGSVSVVDAVIKEYQLNTEDFFAEPKRKTADRLHNGLIIQVCMHGNLALLDFLEERFGSMAREVLRKQASPNIIETTVLNLIRRGVSLPTVKYLINAYYILYIPGCSRREAVGHLENLLRASQLEYAKWLFDRLQRRIPQRKLTAWLFDSDYHMVVDAWENKADSDPVDAVDLTAQFLETICANGSLETARWVIETFKVHATYVIYRGLIRVACKGNNLLLVQWLVDYCDPDLTNSGVMHEIIMAFREACVMGNLAIAIWIADRLELNIFYIRYHDVFIHTCEQAQMRVATWLVWRFELDSRDARMALRSMAQRRANRLPPPVSRSNEKKDLINWLKTRFDIDDLDRDTAAARVSENDDEEDDDDEDDDDEGEGDISWIGL